MATVALLVWWALIAITAILRIIAFNKTILLHFVYERFENNSINITNTYFYLRVSNSHTYIVPRLIQNHYALVTVMLLAMTRSVNKIDKFVTRFRPIEGNYLLFSVC